MHAWFIMQNMEGHRNARKDESNITLYSPASSVMSPELTEKDDLLDHLNSSLVCFGHWWQVGESKLSGLC